MFGLCSTIPCWGNKRMPEFAPLPAGLETVRRIGVIADTHIPDRVRSLHPDLLPGLRAAQVDLLLHLGDICVPSVLTELEQLAPVIAVRGNRDWAFAGILPWVRTFSVNGMRIAMQHGMGSFWHYWWDKLKFETVGYRFPRYKRLLLRTTPGNDIMIFGHTHHPVSLRENGVLFFNPGSACRTPSTFPPPSFGLLHLDGQGGVEGQIIELGRLTVAAGNWVK